MNNTFEMFKSLCTGSCNQLQYCDLFQSGKVIFRTNRGQGLILVHLFTFSSV